MHTHTNKHDISYAPTDTADLYPDTDGKPMAASDLHLEILIWLILALRAYFADMPDTYVSGDILTYPRTTCTLTSTPFRRIEIFRSPE